MDEHASLLEQAYKEAKLADYMAYVTSKLIKDKKLLISIIDHINKSFIFTLTAFLNRERSYRRIPPVPQEPLLLIQLFFDNYSSKMNINTELKNVMIKINKMLKAYNERGMLLQKASKYVFISSDYEMLDLKTEDVKEWLKLNINFVNLIKERMKV